MEQYVGIPYNLMNCADLALKVQSDLYDKKYPDYKKPEGETPFLLSKAVKENLSSYTKEIDEPVEGCLILMKCRNRICHIGTYFEKNNRGFVLHTSDSFGSSIITSIANLHKYFISVEGFYQWR